MSNPEIPSYSKLVDSDALTETYSIPLIKNILSHEDTWKMHNRETVSLADTSALAVKTVISQDACDYVNQHDLSQHNNYLDYSDIRAKGFAAGPDTSVTWNKVHEGNHNTNHAGTMTQDCQVKSENMVIKAPKIHYEYGNRDTTLSGDTLSQVAVNATINIGEEQSVINKASESTPSYQELIGQGTEVYSSQNFNYKAMSLLATQFSHNSPLIIKASRFELADFLSS